MKKNEIIGFMYLMIIGFAIMVFKFIFELLNNIFNEIVLILPFIIFISIILIVLCIIYIIYENYYYKSKNFIITKKKIEKNTKECNELNDHIEDLKNSFIDIKTIEYGNSIVVDTSKHKYKRSEYQNIKNNKYTHNCSLSVFSNAQQQPFKYICKYFDILANEKSLESFENILNNFSAAEQGKDLLLNERATIVDSVKDEVPFLIRELRKKTLLRKLGFDDIDFSQIYFPIYSFQYISAAGNSSQRCDVTFDINNLNEFINYLSSIIKFKKSIAGQRALMTSNLREEIKKRDGYECKICGLSIKDEQNLLLEIDHVIPLSKGGMTTIENLQTLCWKCNRRKSNKIL